MQRRTLIGGILLLTALALGFFGRSALRGSLLDDASIDTAIHMRADSNSDGALSTRELRVALIDIVRGVLLQRDGYDINGDGTVTRADLTSAKQSLRRLLTASCGNGAVEAAEQCDDGNTANGDGCSAQCSTEDGYTCSGAPSTCTASTCDVPTQLVATILDGVPPNRALPPDPRVRLNEELAPGVVVHGVVFDAQRRIAFAITRDSPSGAGTYVAVFNVPQDETAPVTIRSWTKLTNFQSRGQSDSRLFLDAPGSRLIALSTNLDFSSQISAFTYTDSELSLTTSALSPVTRVQYSQLALLGDTLLLHNPADIYPKPRDVLYRLNLATLAVLGTQQVPSGFTLEGGEETTRPSLRITAGPSSLILHDLASVAMQDIAVTGLDAGETLRSIYRPMNPTNSLEYILVSDKPSGFFWQGIPTDPIVIHRRIQLSCSRS